MSPTKETADKGFGVPRTMISRLSRRSRDDSDEEDRRSSGKDKTSGKVLVNPSFISKNMYRSAQPMMPLRSNHPMASYSDPLLSVTKTMIHSGMTHPPPPFYAPPPVFPNFSVPPPSMHSLPPPPRAHTIPPRMVIRNENWENAVDQFLKHNTVPDYKPHPNKRSRSPRRRSRSRSRNPLLHSSPSPGRHEKRQKVFSSGRRSRTTSRCSSKASGSSRSH